MATVDEIEAGTFPILLPGLVAAGGFGVGLAPGPGALVPAPTVTLEVAPDGLSAAPAIEVVGEEECVTLMEYLERAGLPTLA